MHITACAGFDALASSISLLRTRSGPAFGTRGACAGRTTAFAEAPITQGARTKICGTARLPGGSRLGTVAVMLGKDVLRGKETIKGRREARVDRHLDNGFNDLGPR